jgi:hypothetical protein
MQSTYWLEMVLRMICLYVNALNEIKQMQIQSTYWLEKVLRMICLYVSALLCMLQHTVIHAMQLSGVNSEN